MKEIVFAIGIFMSLHSVTSAAPHERTPVTIGVIAPLTLGNADAGKDIQRTLETLLSEFNQQSKVYEYRFVLEDGKCGVGSSATTSARKLIDIDKVDLLITSCSGETLQAGTIAQKAHIPTIAVYSSHKDVKDLGDFVYRTFLDMERGIGVLAEALSESHDSIAVLTENNRFTVGLFEVLKPLIEDKLVYSGDFGPETTDFKTLLLKAKSKNPSAYYMNCASPKTLSVMVNQARQLGIEQPLYSYLYPAERSFLEATGRNSEGIRFLAIPDANTGSTDFSQFLTRFEEKYGEKPHYNFLVAATYNALVSFYDATQAMGANTLKIREFLSGYKGKGALGPIEYDLNGDIKDLNFVLKEIVQGQPRSLQPEKA